MPSVIVNFDSVFDLQIELPEPLGPPTPPTPVEPPVFPGVINALLGLDNVRATRKKRMVAEQIIGRRFPVLDNNGNPVSGGSVDVFAPNTTTRVQSFSDSALTQVNTNPVPLSGSGRADIWVGTPVDIRVNDKDGDLVTNELGLNPANIVSGFNSGLVPNGSFELDTDSDDVPDGWTNDVNRSGSDNGLESGVGNTAAGSSSWRTSSTGNGGGELVTASPFEVNDFDDLRVEFVMRSTVAAVRNIVRVEWLDVSQALISNTDVLDSTANPTVFTRFNFLATPPAGARFANIRLIGGESGGTIAGTTYWDNVNVFYPIQQIGVFDNITIQNNDIISTDTNGAINITPDGTGVLTLGGSRVDVSAAQLNVGDALNVTGNAVVGGTLGAVGAITGDSVSSVNAMVAGSTLSSVGDAVIGGALGVTGLTTLTDSLVVNGASITAADADVNAQSYVATNPSTFAGATISAALAVTDVATIQEAVFGPSVSDAVDRVVRVVSSSSNPMLTLDRVGAADASSFRMSGQSTGESFATFTNTPGAYTRPGASGAGNELVITHANAPISVFGRLNVAGADLLVSQGDVQTSTPYGLHPGAGLNYTSKVLSFARVQVVFNLGLNSILSGRVNSILVQNGVGGAVFTYRNGNAPPAAATPTNQVGVIVNSVQYSGAAAASQSLVLAEPPEWASVSETILCRIGNIDGVSNAPSAAITVTLELTLVYSSV